MTDAALRKPFANLVVRLVPGDRGAQQYDV